MISIQINERDIARVEKTLAGMPKVAGRVLSRSLNKTLAGIKTDASAEIRKELNVKKETVDSTFSLQKATVSRLSASIESTGRPLPLSKFLGTKQTKKGVSVRIKKGRSRKVIKGTFMATMSSGHVGVFWRVGKERLPISQRFSSRVPDVFSNEAVINAVMKKAGERLHKNINHELDYELGKLKR